MYHIHRTMLFITLAILLQIQLVLAANDRENALYPDFARLTAEYGYDFETYQVKTEDGWHLTLFRIKGNIDLHSSEEHQHKLPLLMVHGAIDSAFGFISRGIFGKVWTLQMLEKGYDVWLHNARGVTYSDKNDKDGEWSLNERWSFTWADMGYYDLPASIDKIIEVTLAPKVTVIGHSMGTSQMLYALAKR